MFNKICVNVTFVCRPLDEPRGDVRLDIPQESRGPPREEEDGGAYDARSTG